MKRRVLVCFFVGLFVVGLAICGLAETVEEAFRKSFPQARFDAINPTDVKGLYEVVAGTTIAYFVPETGYLILGEIIGRNGINLTTQRVNEIILSKAGNLPLNKAIRIGKGKHVVIEFTDPDCPYCRRMSLFFEERNDVARYIFFFPLTIHKDAENKVKYILCSQDRVKAYGEAMKGKLDDQKYEICNKPEVEDLIKLHKETSVNLGINGTPFFIINNVVISGANMPQIEEALRQK